MWTSQFISFDILSVSIAFRFYCLCSNKVVDQMKRQRPEMNFAVQDVTDMADFAQDQQFTVALDKGTY